MYTFDSSDAEGTVYEKTQYTINDDYIGLITIGIDVSSSAVDGKDTETQLLEFANEVGYDSWSELKQAFVDKGWTVTFQYGGSSNSVTYGLRGETEIPLPIYAQLIEEKNKDRAAYINEDGTKFYNINWGHDVTDVEGFQQFDSLEDAAVAYGIVTNFKKENVEESVEE